MSKYWTTVKHYKAAPSDIRLEHIWKHTLRKGRKSIACWTVTNLSPMMVADYTYIEEHTPDTIRIVIEGNENYIEVYPHLVRPQL